MDELNPKRTFQEGHAIQIERAVSDLSCSTGGGSFTSPQKSRAKSPPARNVVRCSKPQGQSQIQCRREGLSLTKSGETKSTKKEKVEGWNALGLRGNTSTNRQNVQCAKANRNFIGLRHSNQSSNINRDFIGLRKSKRFNDGKFPSATPQQNDRSKQRRSRSKSPEKHRKPPSNFLGLRPSRAKISKSRTKNKVSTGCVAQ